MAGGWWLVAGGWWLMAGGSTWNGSMAQWLNGSMAQWLNGSMAHVLDGLAYGFSHSFFYLLPPES
ncbi:hypothetical protein EAF00_003800 [Botryotinia globosa]|nr:hypothetical protein EAF00_003800 [Botryotinia globosa]